MLALLHQGPAEPVSGEQDQEPAVLGPAEEGVQVQGMQLQGEQGLEAQNRTPGPQGRGRNRGPQTRGAERHGASATSAPGPESGPGQPRRESWRPRCAREVARLMRGRESCLGSRVAETPHEDQDQGRSRRSHPGLKGQVSGQVLHGRRPTGHLPRDRQTDRHQAGHRTAHHQGGGVDHHQEAEGPQTAWPKRDAAPGTGPSDASRS